MKAFRNIRICGKDCMCLYVCPTGATNTENSIIDVEKCIGCMSCRDACTSGAISMVPDKFPPQQPKDAKVLASQHALAARKVQQEQIARSVAVNSNSYISTQFAEAIAESNRRMAEDMLREAGFMLPQSDEVCNLLEEMIENAASDFPVGSAKLLLKSLFPKENENV